MQTSKSSDTTKYSGRSSSSVSEVVGVNFAMTQDNVRLFLDIDAEEDHEEEHGEENDLLADIFEEGTR